MYKLISLLALTTSILAVQIPADTEVSKVNPSQAPKSVEVAKDQVKQSLATVATSDAKANAKPVPQAFFALDPAFFRNQPSVPSVPNAKMPMANVVDLETLAPMPTPIPSKK